jgi:hypothetical protein
VAQIVKAAELAQLYRKAVEQLSPGLPRFAATLGNGSKDRQPQRGCVGSSGQVVMSFSSELRFDRAALLAQGDATPLGLLLLGPSTQGSREARQPWARLHNRFAVERIISFRRFLCIFEDAQLYCC